EGVLITLVKGFSAFFQRAGAYIALFFSVNFWLLQGHRDKRLALKKERLYNDVMHGTLPIGIGAAAAITFILILFVLT
ncbi:MAG: Na(+)/H(+) antiporter subunit D, partial [Desulfobacterales bacterium]|nr:Na(+)/H(+) antiporter subunit D [Desulfobacterales bacterium]